MASESVTKAVEFDKAPSYPCGMFQVNPGIDTFHALGNASILSRYVQERLVDAVGPGVPIEGDEAYVLAILADMSRALYKACGAEA